MKALALTLLLLLLMATSVTAAAAPADDILAVLRDAEAGWNAGDLVRYMAAYWQDDALRFAGGDDVTFGWQATLDRYRAHYPDRATMGTLVFSDLDVTLLGEDAALVFGRWELQRADDRPHGLFTLLWRRLPGGWRIVHDHTSAAR